MFLVAAVKEKLVTVIQWNLAAWKHSTAVEGLTGTLIGLLKDSRWLNSSVEAIFKSHTSAPEIFPYQTKFAYSDSPAGERELCGKVSSATKRPVRDVRCAGGYGQIRVTTQW